MGIFDRDYMGAGHPLDAWKRPPGEWSAIQLLLAINISVWLIFTVSGAVNPSFTGNVYQYFGVSVDNLKNLYLWTPLTSIFSHTDFFHILFNMFIMWSFGRAMEQEIGGKATFLRFFVMAGLFASFVHCAADFFTPVNGLAIGASGAISAMLMFFVIRNPHQTILLFGVLPIPAYVLLIGMGLFDFIGLSRSLFPSETAGISTVPGTAHGAHLGGMLFGYLYFEYYWSKGKNLSFGRRRKSSRSPRVQSSSNRNATSFVPYESNSSATSPRRPGLNASEEQRMDDLLKRVSEAGLDALSQSDREFLIEMSKKARK